MVLLSHDCHMINVSSPQSSKLENVLIAYSLHNKNVGYCQVATANENHNFKEHHTTHAPPNLGYEHAGGNWAAVPG